MRSRRCNIEIIADILRTGSGGQTNIIYSCDLNYHQFHRYLRFLLRRGLMQVHSADDMRKTYKPTVEGEQLLATIDNVRALLRLEDRDAAMTPRDTHKAVLRRRL